MTQTAARQVDFFTGICYCLTNPMKRLPPAIDKSVAASGF